MTNVVSRPVSRRDVGLERRNKRGIPITLNLPDLSIFRRHSLAFLNFVETDSFTGNHFMTTFRD